MSAQAPRPPRPLRSQPLWARVDENRVKIGVFVVLFVTGSAALLALALVAVPGSLLGLVFGGALWYAMLPWVVLASFGVLLALGALLAAVQLANAEDWVRNRFAGRPLEGQGAFESAVEDMAVAAGLPEPPRLLLLDSDGVNALALGTTRKRAVIGVTRGFLSALTVDEQRAVVATLIARICAGDIMFGTALAALMGPLRAIRETRNVGSGCAADGCSGCSSVDAGDGCSGADGCSGCSDIGDADGCAGAIAMAVFIAVVIAITYVAVLTAAWIVTIWGRLLQRTSYEKADAEGMLLLKDPGPMLSALSKVVRSDNAVGAAEGDPSYDGIFYAATSGLPAIERTERRRFERLREVVGVDGLAASLPEGGGE
jgi:Zn-dependent protease with chaperone function